MNQDFKDIVDQLEPTLLRLVSSKPIDISTITISSKLAGVYVFYEGEDPVYVGRTRNLRARVKGHRSITKNDAGSFAFFLARKWYGSEKVTGGRKALYADPVFRKHLEKANERLKMMSVKFVEISDPRMQHVFEIYAAMALATDNSFETH